MPEREPHREQDERPDGRSAERGPVIAAVAIGLIVVVFIALHLFGVIGPGLHAP